MRDILGRFGAERLARIGARPPRRMFGLDRASLEFGRIAMSLIPRAAMVALLGALLNISGSAQPYLKASPKATVSQTVDGTTIAVEYSRPSARGRVIFGSLVKWDAIWTPGANWATTFEFTRDVTMAGEKVAAGKYSVWTLPGESEWKILLHEDPELFHLKKPKPDECSYSLTVPPHAAPHVEQLAFYFTDITPDSTILNLHWGETAIALPIKIEPSFKVTKLTQAEVAPYLGRYDFNVFAGGPEPNKMKLTVVAVEGELRGYLGNQETIQLIPTGTKNRFLFADVRAARIVNLQDFPINFVIGDDGRASSFDFRNDPGGVRITGKRLD